MSTDPVSLKNMPNDDVPRRMMTLLLEMLKSGELADDNVLLIFGAFNSVFNLTYGRPSLAQTAVECGVYELVVAQLNALGSPADWVTLSRSRGKAGIAGQLAACTINVIKCFAGQAAAGPGGLRLQRAVRLVHRYAGGLRSRGRGRAGRHRPHGGL